MINSDQLRQNVVRPALKQIGHWSEAAENLVMGTAAQESRMGEFLVQIGGGPARGIFQMEPETAKDIFANFINHRPALLKAVEGLRVSGMSLEQSLTTNLMFAAAMCRVHYLRKPGALPEPDDVKGMAAYWKRHYNTHLGAGKEIEFEDNYHRFVKGG